MKREILQRIDEVFRNMEKENTDYLYIPLSDDHQSEYVPDAFQYIRYLTGFTGSNATVVFNGIEKKAYLWTDGRYFIQAEKELDGTGVVLMRMGEKDVPAVDSFLKDRLQSGSKIVICAPITDAVTGFKIETLAENANAVFCAKNDLKSYFDMHIEPVSRGAYDYLLKYAGRSFRDKLADVREKLADSGCNTLALKNLEEICWLFNVRGQDIPCNPVVLSFALITKREVILYLFKNTITDTIERYAAENGFVIRDYDRFYDDLRNTEDDDCFLCDETDMNYSMRQIIETKKSRSGTNPIPLLKAVKNETEQKWILQRFLEDSVTLTEYICALKQDQSIHDKTEYEVAVGLNNARFAMRDIYDLSFDTIAAFGPNAAMMHYEPTEEKSDLIGYDNFLLIDSGGQYLGATTDVTRTIPFGNITEEMKEAYTDTVVSNLRLMDTAFINGTCGMNLDILARERFWKKGQDYKCGTGHGIGSFLSVHEAPPNISWQYRKGRDIPLLPGMIVSDEPGVYRAGEFGIRVENILMVVPFTETPEGTFYRFKNLTKVPLENSCMLKEKMSPEDIERYNAFQKDVFESLKPYLSQNALDFVQNMTVPL